MHFHFAVHFYFECVKGGAIWTLDWVVWDPSRRQTEREMKQREEMNTKILLCTQFERVEHDELNLTEISTEKNKCDK